ncbi:hypothetical protein EVAR_6026_1 [Eumeta japonica]|uniref:Uncharacterized protein n=1 Tax=Eumeta variegata TaxID=151549 RepID=A0A4C1T9L2_EUMVA|nr:hypothetical protein EVAR_6026_1 [Eumeta japonica]
MSSTLRRPRVLLTPEALPAATLLGGDRILNGAVQTDEGRKRMRLFSGRTATVEAAISRRSSADWLTLRRSGASLT